MDEPATLPFRRRPPTLADLVNAERAQIAAGQAEPRGKQCDDGCHRP